MSWLTIKWAVQSIPGEMRSSQSEAESDRWPGVLARDSKGENRAVMWPLQTANSTPAENESSASNTAASAVYSRSTKFRSLPRRPNFNCHQLGRWECNRTVNTYYLTTPQRTLNKCVSGLWNSCIHEKESDIVICLDSADQSRISV